MTPGAQSRRAAWQAFNQRSLMARVDAVAELLRGPQSGTPGGARGEPVAPADDPGFPAAIDALAGLFGLSDFEQLIVALCAGLELDATIGPLCAAATGDPGRPYPTFGVALAVLPGAHWSALVPGGPLRRWRLVTCDLAAGLTAGRLSIDERVLHYLTGVEQLDERLGEVLLIVPAAGALPPSQRAAAEAAAQAWTRALEAGGGPIVRLCGPDPVANEAVAAEAAAMLGVTLHRIEPGRAPGHPG